MTPTSVGDNLSLQIQVGELRGGDFPGGVDFLESGAEAIEFVLEFDDPSGHPVGFGILQSGGAFGLARFQLMNLLLEAVDFRLELAANA